MSTSGNGTMVVYAYLDYEGVQVRAAQRNRDMSLDSVPVVFESPDGQLVTPRNGLRLEVPE